MPIPCLIEVKYGAWLGSLILAYYRFLKQVFKEWCLISSPGIILFYLTQMRAAPLVRALAGCYKGNVSFSFDSNGRSGDGALRERRASDRPFDPSTGLGQPSRQPFEPPQDRPVGLPQAVRTLSATIFPVCPEEALLCAPSQRASGIRTNTPWSEKDEANRGASAILINRD